MTGMVFSTGTWSWWPEDEVPSLYYTPERVGDGYVATTETCPYCGQSHQHGADASGNGDGHRSAHCGRHTHELTPTGRRRSPYARGVAICPGCQERGYVLRRVGLPNRHHSDLR
jgi:hypothetical protein